MEVGPAKAASIAAAGSSPGFLYGLTQEEHTELVESTVPLHECVVRIIRIRKNEVNGTGTAFRVYSGERISLFLTCNHNFGKVKCGEVIRLYHGKTHYRVAKILFRSEKHDLLLFSVESVPNGTCVKFSTDEVKRKDKVVTLGYVNPILPIGSEMDELVLVTDPVPITGVILTEPFEDKKENHEKILSTCETTQGVSGSPLLKNGEVIGVHLAADNYWREAVSCKTVKQVLREWIGVGNDKNDTIEELFAKAYNKLYPNA
ncbi:unnamed protein product [Urochloa humidicola]